ncbi:hypothetical protein GQX74_009801 [Glossina fuscipes]|nr:hypothetical protein GQX74_009801 [Glossina fuscipes]
MFSFDNKLHNQCFQHHREYRNCKQCCCLNKGLMLTILGTIWFIITSIATTQAAAVYTRCLRDNGPTGESMIKWIDNASLDHRFSLLLQSMYEYSKKYDYDVGLQGYGVIS